MAQVVRLKPARKCPICGKPATQANYPFCSPRCQDIDLNRWLSDSYRVPTEEAPAAPSKEDDEE
ncbi:MAG: DNA gyrase inhibitor YacG [Devosia sp. 67-54]|uniref:DNA gyrase inhibitor YacG n=1 Tax=unclassified Devosia TaxID=196773 RepID=UPI00095AD59A|nr:MULTISPECIES: DNA gyrase inhibitor YacG [unclassified Devosia]MBN9306814.1 DNA gyrase inhibitor YacG [Devosia sp.]OJX17128.1 MAG: DNA gyrase inhibitor YacG [Devosia sp. 67-54]